MHIDYCYLNAFLMRIGQYQSYHLTIDKAMHLNRTICNTKIIGVFLIYLNSVKYKLRVKNIKYIAK